MSYETWVEGKGQRAKGKGQKEKNHSLDPEPCALPEAVQKGVLI